MKIETNLQRIEQLSKERDDENWAFRSFLKRVSITDEELDAIVHRINDEVTAQIDCTACANCCKQLWTALSDEDVSTFAAGLPMSVADFEGQYLTLSESGTPRFVNVGQSTLRPLVKRLPRTFCTAGSTSNRSPS